MSTAPFWKCLLHAIFYMAVTAAHGATSIYNKSDGHILDMHIFLYSLSNCKWMKNGGVCMYAK